MRVVLAAQAVLKRSREVASVVGPPSGPVGTSGTCAGRPWHCVSTCAYSWHSGMGFCASALSWFPPHAARVNPASEHADETAKPAASTPNDGRILHMLHLSLAAH
jgi:hypothetical protein